MDFVLISMLPEIRNLGALSLAANLRSAVDICGDFLEFTPNRNGRLVLAVGDESGHGFGPAILTACVMSYLRAF